MSRSPHPPSRVLKVYINVLTGYSSVYCPMISTHYYLKATSSGQLLVQGRQAECTFQRQRKK